MSAATGRQRQRRFAVDTVQRLEPRAALRAAVATAAPGVPLGTVETMRVDPVEGLRAEWTPAQSSAGPDVSQRPNVLRDELRRWPA